MSPDSLTEPVPLVAILALDGRVVRRKVKQCCADQRGYKQHLDCPYGKGQCRNLLHYRLPAETGDYQYGEEDHHRPRYDRCARNAPQQRYAPQPDLPAQPGGCLLGLALKVSSTLIQIRRLRLALP